MISLCQKLLDKSIIIGSFLFYFAILLIIPKALALLKGYIHTADSCILSTVIANIRIGNAHNTLSTIRLSI